jgi:hypothetical protein
MACQGAQPLPHRAGGPLVEVQQASEALVALDWACTARILRRRKHERIVAALKMAFSVVVREVIGDQVPQALLAELQTSHRDVSQRPLASSSTDHSRGFHSFLPPTAKIFAHSNPRELRSHRADCIPTTRADFARSLFLRFAVSLSVRFALAPSENPLRETA